MSSEMIKVYIEGKERFYPVGTTLQDAALREETNSLPVLLAMVDGKLTELYKHIKANSEIAWMRLDSDCGIETYRRSCSMLLLKAIHDLDPSLKTTIQFSISRGYYCTFYGDAVIDQTFVNRIKARMDFLVKQRISFKKYSMPVKEAVRLFEQQGMNGKSELLNIRRGSETNIYSLDGFYDYHYGYMVPDTSYLTNYELYPYQEGLVLQMPVKGKSMDVPAFEPQEKLFHVLDETTKWGEMQGITNITELNRRILKGDTQSLVLIQEALQEKKIAEIAEQIANRGDIKFVLIAGPSSSGKTTFSHRLSVQLSANGMRPRPIAVDNYFVEREENPKDENGNYDFECLGAVDIELFNRQMNELLEGKEVQCPVFDFLEGKKTYNEPPMKLGEKDILVIEGIHCLNPELTRNLDDSRKFKIYISSLTLLNIDDHNRIPTTDARLLRRMIRDARTRGSSASRTITMWDSVRKGEERNIFPFQEEADVMFNSSLIYELSALKLYAEPLLFNIEEDDPAYLEAKRLLKFLNYFIAISSEKIPANSLVREFVGGGCFKV